jgi:hypothetical protein
MTPPRRHAVMNENSKKALQEFTDAVSELAAGLVREIGVKAAGDIFSACAKLKQTLESDETLP